MTGEALRAAWNEYGLSRGSLVLLWSKNEVVGMATLSRHWQPRLVDKGSKVEFRRRGEIHRAALATVDHVVPLAAGGGLHP
jgi:hypothetical protein